MSEFFDDLDYDRAEQAEGLSRLLYELRENRKGLLGAFGCAEPAELLAAIAAGSVAEHPGYEAYLAARILEDTRTAAREALAALIVEARRP